MEIVLGFVFIVAGVLMIVVGTDSQPALVDVQQRPALGDIQQQIIESQDRAMRAQWKTIAILSRRLGEEPPPPPVSLTGLPEP